MTRVNKPLFSLSLPLISSFRRSSLAHATITTHDLCFRRLIYHQSSPFGLSSPELSANSRLGHINLPEVRSKAVTVRKRWQIFWTDSNLVQFSIYDHLVLDHYYTVLISCIGTLLPQMVQYSTVGNNQAINMFSETGLF